MHARSHHAVAVCLIAFCAADLANAVELTLEDALQLTIDRNPRLAAMREAHLATDGRRLEAKARPNPELTFEAENVRFGDGPETHSTLRAPDDSVLERSTESVSNSGFAEAELTLSVSQLIELGGKRARRIALADQEAQAALWEYEIARAVALAQTRRAFVDALAAQEMAALRGRLATLATEAAAAVGLRVEAGKDSPILRDRAEVEHAQARIALDAATRQTTAARYVLAAQWDEHTPVFEYVGGDLFRADVPPSRAALFSALEQSPDLRRWTAEVSAREAAVALARAERAPDLTVNLGWRGLALPKTDERIVDSGGTFTAASSARPEDDWAHALVFGVSVPLPLFGRNRGRILEAEHLALQATHDRRAGLADTRAQIAAVHAEVESAYTAVVELREAVLPAATRAYDAATLGFESGKFTYLDSLDAQRTLFEVQSHYIEALATYHRGMAELERLVGAPVAQKGVSQ